MKINEVVIKRNTDNDYAFTWDNDRGGFAVTVDGEEQAFYKAKDPKWDRSGAQELARKHMIKLRAEATMKRQQAEKHEYEYNRPLSALELQWVEMTNRFMSLDDKELHRWKQLDQIIRDSLRDGTHPAVKQ